MKTYYRYLSFTIRSFLIRILCDLTHRLGKLENVMANVRIVDEIRCIEGKENHDYKSSYIFYETKKVKVKHISHLHKYYTLENLTCKCPAHDANSIYPWEELIKSIKKNGIIKNPTVMRQINNKTPYTVRDGNHRVKAWELIHGEDSEITVNIYTTIKYLKYVRALNKHKISLSNKRLEELAKKTK